MTVLIESFYRAKILTPIQSTDAASTGTPLVIWVSEVPVKTSGYLTISPNTDNEEIVYYSAIDGTALTISITKRAISPTTSALTVDGTDWNVTAQKKSHSVLDSIRGDINNLHINQISEMVPLSGGVMTGALSFSGTTNPGIRANNLTTVQRDALTPAEGMVIMNTTEGVLQKYETGAWASFASGSVSNASTTVAGKLEVGTQTEVDTPTDTGGTGATVAVIPSTFQTGITNKMASQAEAEAGSSSTKLMTPQRTSQFLTSQLASQAEAEAGSNDAKYMSSLKTKQFVDAYIPTLDDTFGRNKIMTTTFTDTLSNFDTGIPFGTYSTICVDFTILSGSDFASSTGTLHFDWTNNYGNSVIVGKTVTWVQPLSIGYGNSTRANPAAWKQYDSSGGTILSTVSLDKWATNYRINYSWYNPSSANMKAIFRISYA